MTDKIFERCCIADIETIPDLKAARALLNLADTVPDVDVRSALQEYCMPITPGKTDVFIKPILQRIAAVGLVEIIRETRSSPWAVRHIVSTSLDKRSEAEILARFEAILTVEPRPSIIGWNSHGFDLPLLRHRAMALGVPMPTLLFRYPEDTPKWKWNDSSIKPRDYWKRYGDDHIDLMETLSSFGASSKSKMREVAATLGIPSKSTMDGSMVESAVNQGLMASVENYVQEDVVSLYCIFLSYELSAGKITRASYEASLQNLREYIEKKGPEAAHLYPFDSYASERITLPPPAKVEANSISSPATGVPPSEPLENTPENVSAPEVIQPIGSVDNNTSVALGNDSNHLSDDLLAPAVSLPPVSSGAAPDTPVQEIPSAPPAPFMQRPLMGSGVPPPPMSTHRPPLPPPPSRR